MTLSCSWPLSVQHSPASSAADLWQHRVNNNDWSNGWSWTDDRLGLLHAPHETFLRFLAEMVPPSVRPDQEQREAYLEVFNKHLVAEGWEIGIVSHVGAHPGQVGRRQRRNREGAIQRQMAARAQLLLGR